MPFPDNSVHFIHCSHLIEHLYPDQLYRFLKAVDRVLARGGVLVISTPLLWERFYEDLSHIKPYYPEVLIKYLCGKKGELTRKALAGYTVEKLVYRYRAAAAGAEWGSKYFLLDLVISASRQILAKLGIKKYIKNGYTIILKKHAATTFS